MLATAGCQTPVSPPSAELVRRSQPLLGTYVVVAVYATDRRAAHAAITAAFAEVRRVDALMSLHRPDSELSRLNGRAAADPGEVSPELFRVMAAAQEIAAATDGSFDITVAPLVRLWGFLWKEYRLPSPAELQSVLPQVGYRLVELDAARRTVRFRRAGVELDLGGIAKGYAVDCAIEKLRALGLTNALVRAGGDLRASGAPPGRNHWEVQLEDPARRGRRVVIPLRDSAVSTAGNYENVFVVNGRRYSHILDPRTGLPVEGVAACTVLAPTCLESDAWSTACFVFGVERSLERFGAHLGIRFVMPGQANGPAWRSRASPRFPPVCGE